VNECDLATDSPHPTRLTLLSLQSDFHFYKEGQLKNHRGPDYPK